MAGNLTIRSVSFRLGTARYLRFRFRAKAQKIVARIPRGQMLSYGCTHFEPYLDPHFEQIVSEQIQFLQRHVPISS